MHDLPEIPAPILDQIMDKCTEGLALALASDEDGAVMYLQWCNRAFTKITGYEPDEVIGQRGTVLIGPSMDQGNHLIIIEKLMNWEHFSVKTLNNRKDGEPYWQKMIWTPLSDPATGSRWWLCSLIELEDEPVRSSRWRATDGTPAEFAERVSYIEKIKRLEKENARLHDLA